MLNNVKRKAILKFLDVVQGKLLLGLLLNGMHIKT